MLLQAMPDNLNLHLLTYTDEAERRFSTFIALTDQELSQLLEQHETSLAPYKNRIISVVRDTEPTASDINTARDTFERIFNTRRGL